MLSAIWFVPVPATRLKAGALGVGAVPVGVEPPPPLLPVESVESIFLICKALKAPANPACIAGYAGNTVVIGDLDAVVNAFCTPSIPLIVALATATPLPTALSLPAISCISSLVLFLILTLAFSTDSSNFFFSFVIS